MGMAVSGNEVQRTAAELILGPPENERKVCHSVSLCLSRSAFGAVCQRFGRNFPPGKKYFLSVNFFCGKVGIRIAKELLELRTKQKN